MICERRLSMRLSFLLFLLAFSLAVTFPALAQENPPLNPSGSSWNELDQLLNQLEDEAMILNADSVKLKELLAQAQQQLIVLSSKLEESRTAGKELSSLLAQSAQSLSTSVESLNKERGRIALELWIWRGATAASVVALILSLLR